jgi:hypothetical protein
VIGGSEWYITPESIALHQFKSLASVADARQSLIWNWHYTIKTSMLGGQLERNNLQEAKANLKEWRNQALVRLNEWGSKLELFLENRGASLSDWEKKGVKVLQIHRLLAWTTLSVNPRNNQTGWDEFRPVFEEIVNLAAAIVEVDNPASDRTALFSADMGITGPLYDVVARCRHPVTRRKAIAVLKHGVRQEGIWNSFLTAKIAERVMEIEEQGCGEVKEEADIPDWARISNVSPVFDAVARRATLTYSRPDSRFDFVRKTVEEIIEW